MSYYRQNDKIILTSRYGFRIWQRDEGKKTFQVSFTLTDEGLEWPVNHSYSLTKDDLYRMYVFIGGMLADKYVDGTEGKATNG